MEQVCLEGVCVGVEIRTQVCSPGDGVCRKPVTCAIQAHALVPWDSPTSSFLCLLALSPSGWCDNTSRPQSDSHTASDKVHLLSWPLGEDSAPLPATQMPILLQLAQVRWSLWTRVTHVQVCLDQSPPALLSQHHHSWCPLSRSSLDDKAYGHSFLNSRWGWGSREQIRQGYAHPSPGFGICQNELRIDARRDHGGWRAKPQLPP